MTRYFLRGNEVSRREAIAVWHDSATYARAGRRNLIWMHAERGIDDGGAAATHLAEAGIEIRRAQQEASSDE